jgi:hypothetical protein
MRPYQKVLICFTGILVLLWAAHTVVVKIGCTTETKMKMSLPGEDVEVVYLSCDTLAKQDTIDVYVMNAGANKQPSWIRWLYKKTLVFRYDPALEDGPLPAIRASGRNRIVIAVPEVSSVLVKARNWRDVSIDYEIGKTDYPEMNVP